VSNPLMDIAVITISSSVLLVMSSSLLRSACSRSYGGLAHTGARNVRSVFIIAFWTDSEYAAPVQPGNNLSFIRSNCTTIAALIGKVFFDNLRAVFLDLLPFVMTSSLSG